MASKKISEQRIQLLNDAETREGDFTLYWMQQSQRAESNHALEYAIQRANQIGDRLLVVFVLTDDYPDANLRHYQFMLQGLQEVSKSLRQRNIRFAIGLGDPPKTISKLARKASALICDRGYLRHQVKWRKEVAQHAGCRVWQVESDVIVPVEEASDKREYAARTIRSKLNGLRDECLRELATTPIEKNSKRLPLPFDSLDLSDVESLLRKMSIDRSVEPCDEFLGGTSRAKAMLGSFVQERLSNYENRPDVVNSNVSFLSPYLHFGQISPLQIALEISSSRGHRSESKEAFLEELLVRRELAVNFVHFEPNYDNINCLPQWAADTLSEHESDERSHRYTSTELESAETHDPAWNAAMVEMKQRGYLHNHLRMYWGKKIIEWTNTTNHAYRTALELNNRYFVDGRDANSYANILWLFGLHDRAHQEREIFGKVRYMS